MQNDLVHFSTSGHMTDVNTITETSSVKSFQCSRCMIIFKSKVYLFEHLNNVHGLDVDTALREAGLKHHETITVYTANKINNLGNFQCQHCDFKACSQEKLTEHETRCKKRLENRNGIVNPICSENQGTEIILISTEQHKEGAEAKESLSDESAPETKYPVHSSKDLKTYKRPLQTITKYFLPPSGSQGKPSMNLSENAQPSETREMQETIILKESPSTSSPESSGVFKVTAKSMIDISKQGSHRFLLDDHLVISDLTPPEPVEQITKKPPNKWGKRSHDEQLGGNSAKKAKFSKKQVTLPEEAKEKEQQSSSNTDFLFEISDDEEEKMANLLNGDTASPKLYLCKQCDYSDIGTRNISAHYQNYHPYLKYNLAYIQDQSNQSATFRCLECPVEFLNVADLKRHYAEHHPEAPNVFSKQLCKLNLVFRCFVCPFTSNVLKPLKRHYKEKHPKHKVDNSLLYCRYSVAQQEEVKNALPPIQPTSKGSNMVLYHCNNCKFSHKSVVVMHVHYQRSHPDEEVTIDKIKQSVHVTSQTTPQMTPEKTVTVTENNTPQNNILDSSKKAKLQRKVSLSLNLKHTPDVSNTESPTPEKVKTAKEGSKTKTSATKSNRRTPAATDSSSSSSPNQLFYCQFCCYSSTNVRSVAGHHKVKHAEHGLRDTEDILRYSAEVWRKRQSKTEASARATSSDPKPSKQVGVSEKEVQHEEDNIEDASVMTSDPYACAENLFYCHKCNFGNPTVKGVVNHQNAAHQRINTNLETILEYTALIRDKIKKSKSKTDEFASSTHLPLPLLNEGDEELQFCPLCNYRHNAMDRMLRHCFQRHREAQVKAHQIQRYTLEVLKRAQNLLLQTTASQAAKNASLVGKGKKKKTKMLPKSFSVSASPSVSSTKTKRNFKCYRCPYSSNCLSVLRRHMWKIHRSNRSVHEILQVLYKRGSLQSGYHCDTCVFSHEDAAAVHKHFKEQHPERKMIFDYISRRLYVGPDKKNPEDKKAKIKHIDSTSDGAGTDGSLLSQRSGQNKTKRHSCRACSFRGRSVSSLARHYRAVHPWTVKDDGSVLNVITSEKLSENSDVEDHNEMPGTFVKQEVPPGPGRSLSLSREVTESPSEVKCRHCPAIFNTHHGLKTHYGMKHLDALCESSAKPQVQRQTRVHVFKCPYCTYINTSYHGVLTHCQMKHPTFASRADSTHVDEKHVRSWKGSLKRKDPGDSSKFRGYMCETCSQIHATLEKLNKHCENDHNDRQQNAIKPALKPLAISNLQQSNNHSSRGSVSKASFLSKRKFARIKCQHCSYTCTNKLALSRHVQLHHRNASNVVLRKRDFEYKCTLCFSSYFSKKCLENHYIRKHGKDAFLKYCAEVGKHVPEQPTQTSLDFPLSQHLETTSAELTNPNTTTEEKRVKVFKCPRCPYVNACTHGILTHCQMRHPTVVARADELKIDEILVSKMVGCTMGKGSNERGYKCKKCPQVYATLMKLKVHQEMKHKQAGQAASDHSTDTQAEKQTHFDSDYSVLEALALKNNSNSLGTATAEKTTDADHSQQPTSPEKCLVSLQNEKSQYKCTMCSYMGICRKYLQCHYKNAHKLDPLSIYKLLVNYTKRKCSYLHKAMLEESAQFKCKKCPNLTFDSSQLLIAHYSVLHSKMDFTMLSEPSKNYTGLYRCAHCRKKIRGIGKLCYHLDRHAAREKKKAKAARSPPVITTIPEATSFEPNCEEELPVLETVEELTPLNVTPVESVTFPTSPPTSPSKPTHVEQPELETRQDKHRCKRCERNFNSLKGLRLHERSHAALAAIKKLDHLPTSVQKHSIDKYLLFKSGTLRPFVCVICSFRTTVLGLWRKHFTKNHHDVIVDSAETDKQDKESAHRAGKEPSNLPEDSSLAEPDEEPDMADAESLYLEPPDVQRQLNNYSLVAQTRVTNLQQTATLQNSLLHCESCSFSTGHLSSLRRHYSNRHGKKILKCKDCDFLTGSRKILEMHVEMGHSTFQSQATQERVLRCPFCMYQTKTKNSMIDHIVLHRDERIVPIEVRRSKLSRYLHGIVFRCHKCTFTSGCAENLRLHMVKHDDIKPYKCRLCYFDCSLLSDLEAHLSDKHQVMRNHELVGQVSLDQLAISVVTVTKEEEVVQEETSSNLKHHSNDSEDVETEDHNEIKHETRAVDLAESNIGKKTTVQMKEASQDPQVQAGSADLEDKVERDAEKANSADIPSDECSSPEKDRNQAQPQDRHCEDSGIMSPQQKEEAAEGSSTTCCKIAVKMEDDKELQQRTLNIEERVENDILLHILLLDKDEDICKDLPNADQDKMIKTEKSAMSDCGDNTLHESPGGGSIAVVCNPKLEVDPESKRNHTHANNERFKVERHLLTLSPNRVQLKISQNKSLQTISLTKSTEEHVRIQKHREEMTDPYGEMPVLENEYLKDHPTPLSCYKEEEDEMVTEDSGNRCKDQEHEEGDKISAHKSTYPATSVAAEVLCPSVTEKKLYTCELCGRNLKDSSELTRHVMRHGL